MDEVHYLADRFRGAVWEEVIIHLPDVGRAGLAVGDGEQRRGVRRLAGHRARRHHGRRRASTGRCRCGSTCMVGKRLFDLFHDADAASEHDVQPRAAARTPATTERRPSSARRPRRPRPRRGRRGRARRGAVPARRRRAARPRGPAAGDPFIFSRAGCDAAVQQCLRRGLRLTTPEERDRDPRGRRGALRGDLPDEDLAVLGYREWLDGLERGVAAHHAGLLPVVQGGRRGAVRPRAGARRSSPPRRWRSGINMPARMRRARAAGQVQRRGPRRPHAGGVHPADRAGRAGAASTSRATPSCSGSRSLDPRSGGRPRLAPAPTRCARRFRPSYNMAVNLVGQFGAARRPRAAGVVLRAVPGRPGGRRAGPPGAQAARRPSTATARR